MVKKPDIRNKLTEALESKELDYDEVIRLAHSLALEDTANVRFSVDASHIDRLGRELVAKQETAVAELVKNAYDADATSAQLVFKDCESPGGSLEIRDDGHGMNRDELVSGFMRLSTRQKVENPISKKYRRTRAGRKGIGRFATQRLGKRLVLLTQTQGAKRALRLLIDWEMFKDHEDLHTVTGTVTEIDLFRVGPGTTLCIEDLRESWTDEQIKRTFRYISELLQPFPLSKRHSTTSGVPAQDPGFKAVFQKSVDGDLHTVADESSTIFEHAVAIIEGHVDASGFGHWSVESKRYEIESNSGPIGAVKEKPNQPFEHIKNIHLKAYYFVEDRYEGLPWNLRSTIRQTLSDHGGIRLYRNGFRVPPYGGPDDDWLRLNWSYRRRQILPQHTNNNFLGFIEVVDPNGELFEETSSREGLLENQAYQELVYFAYQVILAGVLRVSEERGVKTHSSTRTKERNIKEATDGLAEKVERLSVAGNAANREQTEQIAEEIRSLGEQQETEERERLEELAMMRVLAGMGLSIGEFTHEIRFLTGALQLDLTALTAQPKKGRVAERFKSNLSTLTTYAKYFDQTVANNVHREILPIEIRDAVGHFRQSMDSWLHRKNVRVSTSFEGYGLFTRPMHPSEWAAIFLNLCTNAVKAIERAEVSGRILISGGVKDQSVFIEFSDNGDGIPEEHAERIFEPFFTTTQPTGPDGGINSELIGTGLGLKIVRDIVRNYDGDIELTTPPEGYSTCFRIIIPKATDEEIPHDAY
ncbi:MAG: ATP-binding protein [Parvibaculum sp.]|uniref:sensor histidine kinase n=1 Tax=Parvibaculum sp. TaxID=2024848 RepID=UPI0032EEE9D3